MSHLAFALLLITITTTMMMTITTTGQTSACGTTDLPAIPSYKLDLQKMTGRWYTLRTSNPNPDIRQVEEDVRYLSFVDTQFNEFLVLNSTVEFNNGSEYSYEAYRESVPGSPRFDGGFHPTPVGMLKMNTYVLGYRSMLVPPLKYNIMLIYNQILLNGRPHDSSSLVFLSRSPTDTLYLLRFKTTLRTFCGAAALNCTWWSKYSGNTGGCHDDPTPPIAVLVTK